MDYGQAKTILARIFKEYQAFKDLEDVIEFANLQEQKKVQLQKDIIALKTEREGVKAELQDLSNSVVFKEADLERAEEHWANRTKALQADYEKACKALDATWEANEEAFFNEAAKLEEALEEAHGRVERLSAEADAAEKRLAKAKAAYDKFKESI